MPKGDDLTPKQREFVRQYLLSRNATDAARKAGYSAKTADRIGPELLGKTWVAAAIAAGEKKVQEKFEITQERVLRELAAIAFTPHEKLMTWDDDGVRLVASEDLSPEAMKAVENVEQRISESGDKWVVLKRADRMKALHLLGKHTGLWKELKDAGPEGADSGSREALLKRVSGLLRKRNGSGSPPGASET